MHKVNTSLQRILWLIYVEIRYKLPSIGLMFLVCFAILMVYYWNPSFKVTQLINEFNNNSCLLYTSPSPRDLSTSRMPSSA